MERMTEMTVFFGNFKRKVKYEKIGPQEWSCGYSLTEISGKDIQKIAKKFFLMFPEKSYIRTTPNDGNWLVFRFNGYNCEGKLKINLEIIDNK